MYKLYSRISDHETVLELWEASTKHPDSIFFFSDLYLIKTYLYQTGGRSQRSGYLCIVSMRKAYGKFI